MKSLDGIELKRGDQIIAAGDATQVIMGTIHELYDRPETVRIGGYALMLPAKNVVSAKKAFDAYSAPLIKARDDAEAKAKADAEAAKQAAAQPQNHPAA
jgi:hypothetical protein